MKDSSCGVFMNNVKTERWDSTKTVCCTNKDCPDPVDLRCLFKDCPDVSVKC